MLLESAYGAALEGYRGTQYGNHWPKCCKDIAKVLTTTYYFTTYSTGFDHSRLRDYNSIITQKKAILYNYEKNAKNM